MERVEFVSYDGEYPCLCMGTLVLKIDGKIYDNIKISSGGWCGFDEDYIDKVEEGPWIISYNSIDDDEELKLVKSLEKEITEVVNENIPWGCCGGCL